MWEIQFNNFYNVKYIYLKQGYLHVESKGRLLEKLMRSVYFQHLGPNKDNVLDMQV